MLGEAWVVLAHPDAITEIFSQHPDALTSGEALQVLRPVIGTHNILLMDGDEHLHRRRTVLPAFHNNHTQHYEPIVRKTITTDLQNWPTGEPFTFLPRAEALAFTTIVSCIFGPQEAERMNTFAARLLNMLRWITDTRRLLVLFFAGPDMLMKLPGFRHQMQRIDHEVLTEITRRRAQTNLQQRHDILSMLITVRDENNTGLSDTDLRDELLTLLVAGHKNTSALLAWAIHELARDQNTQKRLATEPETLADAVITETLRLRPPVPLIVRRLRKPLTIAGHQLPVGTNVGPCSLLVHRQPDLYPKPLTFAPTRFPDHKPPPSNKWFPFGGSTRRCIGATFARFEARIILTEIAQNMRITPEQPQPERSKPRAVVLVPNRGARIIATRR